MASPVFQAMFYESIVKPKPTIELNDEDAEACKEVLRYIYTDKPNVSTKNAIFIIYSAKKYALVHLETQCVEYILKILKNMDQQNVIDIYY